MNRVIEGIKVAFVVIIGIIVLGAMIVITVIDSQVKTQNWIDGYQKVYGKK